MPKLYRGDVIRVLAPIIKSNGEKGFKERHVIVLQDSKKDDTVITVYCTGQNNGDDDYNIFVGVASKEGKEMGLTKDTWIRPKTILNLPIKSLVRVVGKCSLMQRIAQMMEKIKSQR